jgi:hypothetical protein
MTLSADDFADDFIAVEWVLVVVADDKFNAVGEGWKSRFGWYIAAEVDSNV